MIAIHIVGIGLEGAVGLSSATRQLIAQATLLVGSPRHLGYFPDHPGDRLPLADLSQTIAQLQTYLDKLEHSPPPSPLPLIVILASGDPLFFGLGRLLLESFPPEQLTFHPHLSSIQLAFSRVKLPWQDACLISAHGRSLERLTQALQQGAEKIGVLTDGTNTPAAIAQLLHSLDLPNRYQMWVCENLGGSDERITTWNEGANLSPPLAFAPLNVVVLQRIAETGEPLDVTALPLFGLPDSYFLSFSDRPGLMTKREVRVQILGELALQNAQVVWDIGAGTGSVAIEIGRLCPASQVYAVEKTAIGSRLVETNCQRFGVTNVTTIQGSAPQALHPLPAPDRIFIGGSGGNLSQILDLCADRLAANGRMVLALATMEHLSEALHWLGERASGEADTGADGDNPAMGAKPAGAWNYRLLQVQLARSVPVANLTRLSPLNPVTLIVVNRQ